MRALFVASALAALSFAGAAAAGPVSLAPVAIAPALQTELEEDFGVREGETLQRWTANAVSRELRNAGADVVDNAPVRVEVTILEADPNRPTFKQLGDKLGLDFSSISIGGAELTATLRSADGRVLQEVAHRRYSSSLDDISVGAATWSDARRAIRQFATKVGDAYRTHASAS